MKNFVLSIVLGFLLLPTLASADEPKIILFQHENAGGTKLTLTKSNKNLSTGPTGPMSDNTTEVLVISGVWRLCEHENYGGRALRLDKPGRYRLDLIAPDLNDNISSVELVKK